MTVLTGVLLLVVGACIGWLLRDLVGSYTVTGARGGTLDFTGLQQRERVPYDQAHDYVRRVLAEAPLTGYVFLDHSEFEMMADRDELDRQRLRQSLRT